MWSVGPALHKLSESLLQIINLKKFSFRFRSTYGK